MESIDLGWILPALLIAPLTLRAVGLWSWTAWLPPRLRAMEKRRALQFIQTLVRVVAEELNAPGPERATVIDEAELAAGFAEAADGIARILPESDDTEGRPPARPVSERLHALAEAALERSLVRAEDEIEQGRRRHLACACLEILRKLRSPANLDVVRAALQSPDPEIADRAASVVTSTRARLPKLGDGDLKVYRQQSV